MPRTVVHVVTSFGVGGTERQLLELLRGLDENRWRSRVICFRKSGALLPEIMKLGHDPRPLPLGGTLLSPHTAVVVGRLARWFTEEHASLVHCHDLYSVLLGVPAARLAGVPVIASRRDLGHHVTAVQRPMLRLALRQATRVLANAATVASRIAIVPNGLDLARFAARTKTLEAPAAPLATPGPPTVLTVARMTYPAKGHDDLLQAMPLVLRETPARFVLVGDGPRETELRALAERLGVSNAVTFLGRRADVPALLARADVVCHPARMEGLPNAVMEAMAAARPLVATSVGGTPELVQDGIHGLLVPPEDPAALAAGILAVLRDPDRAARLARAAHARIESTFRLDQLVSRIDRLYGEIIGAAAPQLAVV